VTLLVRRMSPATHRPAVLESLVHALELDSNVALEPRLGGVSPK
jgi:hypothetical protein